VVSISGGDSVRQSWMLVLFWSIAAVFVVFFAPGFRRAR
jgi:hypothetical protein